RSRERPWYLVPAGPTGRRSTSRRVGAPGTAGPEDSVAREDWLRWGSKPSTAVNRSSLDREAPSVPRGTSRRSEGSRARAAEAGRSGSRRTPTGLQRPAQEARTRQRTVDGETCGSLLSTRAGRIVYKRHAID